VASPFGVVQNSATGTRHFAQKGVQNACTFVYVVLTAPAKHKNAETAPRKQIMSDKQGCSTNVYVVLVALNVTKRHKIIFQKVIQDAIFYLHACLRRPRGSKIRKLFKIRKEIFGVFPRNIHSRKIDAIINQSIYICEHMDQSTHKFVDTL